MQRYIIQLLADMETATRNAPVSSSYRFRHPFNDDEQDSPAYQSRYTRLCELFGLAPGIFPPSERLTKDQLSLLLTAIEALWRAWMIQWDCPPSLTARRRYTIMVERMEQDSVQYNHEFGAEINFCDRRSEGICPFGDQHNCWCDELDACARHDFEIWENAHELDGCSGSTTTPLEEFRRWLTKHHTERPPWDIDENEERWKAFLADEDPLAWLFFYDRSRTDDADDSTSVPPTPEDFEDFDWFDDSEDYGDMPF